MRLFQALLVLSLFSFPLHALELNQEEAPPGEVELIKALSGAIAGKHKASQKKGVIAQRDAHPIHHGCVKAKFKVNSALPAELQTGVFQFKNGKAPTYDAWVRFSNGSGEGLPKGLPDYVPDGRGMAVKLVKVSGERIPLKLTDEKATQDFLMINHPQFFVKNAVDYVGFFKDAKAFMATHETERKIAQDIALQKVTSPLSATYFSMVPISYGQRTIKFSAKPCQEEKAIKIGDVDFVEMGKALAPFKTLEELKAAPKELARWERYLREVMATQLDEKNGKSYCFKFRVQFQQDPEKQPIEDATVLWSTDFIEVAELTIEPQTFTSEAQQAFCENIALTPWHGLVEHRPLGGIQRVRNEVYELISMGRREHNFGVGAKYTEPTGDEKFN